MADPAPNVVGQVITWADERAQIVYAHPGQRGEFPVTAVVVDETGTMITGLENLRTFTVIITRAGEAFAVARNREGDIRRG